MPGKLPQYLTKDGVEKIEKELQELRGPQREALARRLRDAIQMGDLSENADYHKAKEDQAFLEGRIQELEHVLRSASIVDRGTGPQLMVAVGTRVTVQEDSGEPEVYDLVGIQEADPRAGRISYDSPIGRALMDRRVGEIAEAKTPGGIIRLKILRIE